jgi:DNA ligase D-like protein (predicted 3'-phosphoesterase)
MNKEIDNRDLRFVIHEHIDSSPHFDLRLEMDNSLHCWVVPKGIPEEIGIKRLAIAVNNRSVNFIDFEGKLGGDEEGELKIWDTGYYTPESMGEKKLVFYLKGKKLHGKYVLLKTEGYQPDSWLIFKAKSE